MTKPFSLAYKKKMVERMTGTDAVSARALSRETGVTQTTLSRWRFEARSLPVMPPRKRETDDALGATHSAAVKVAGTVVPRRMIRSLLVSSMQARSISSQPPASEPHVPHCPWQSGKVERFNRTLASEWAFVAVDAVAAVQPCAPDPLAIVDGDLVALGRGAAAGARLDGETSAPVHAEDGHDPHRVVARSGRWRRGDRGQQRAGQRGGHSPRTHGSVTPAPRRYSGLSRRAPGSSTAGRGRRSARPGETRRSRTGGARGR